MRWAWRRGRSYIRPHPTGRKAPQIRLPSRCCSHRTPAGCRPTRNTRPAPAVPPALPACRRMQFGVRLYTAHTGQAPARSLGRLAPTELPPPYGSAGVPVPCRLCLSASKEAAYFPHLALHPHLPDCLGSDRHRVRPLGKNERLPPEIVLVQMPHSERDSLIVSSLLRIRKSVPLYRQDACCILKLHCCLISFLN